MQRMRSHKQLTFKIIYATIKIAEGNKAMN